MNALLLLLIIWSFTAAFELYVRPECTYLSCVLIFLKVGMCLYISTNKTLFGIGIKPKVL